MATPAADTADRILDAAEALLAEQGRAGFSLRAVARSVGITPMAVYRHHDGLDALLDALRDRGFGYLMQHLQRSLVAPTVRERMATSAREYLAFAHEHPALYRLLFATAPPHEHVPDPEMRRNATSFRFMVDRVREAMDTGVLAAGDPEARAIDWWALFHGLAMLQLDTKLKLDDAAFDAHVESTLTWLLGPA
jgi:AcrR family transcriptional regulator